MSDAQPCALLFGSGRSGTTWIQDALADANGLGTLYEPLHPDVVPGADAFANLYQRPAEESPALQAFFGRIVDNRINSAWIRYRARPDRMWPSPRNLSSRANLVRTLKIQRNAFGRWRHERGRRNAPRLVKLIRGNLLIEWLSRRIDARLALVVRHPCAVYASVSRRGGEDWGDAAMRALLARYLAQEDLVADRLQRDVDRLRTLRSPAAVHAATWCIENAWLMAERDRLGLTVVFYEHLLADSDDAWRRLADGLGLANIPDSSLRLRPSLQATFDRSGTAKADRQRASWQTALAGDQVADIGEILELFGVREYSTDSVLPVLQREPGT